MPLFLNYNQPIIAAGSFVWAEYARLKEWDVFAIPTKEEQDRAVFLFTMLEKLVRKPIGKRITISSGARTKQYTAFLRSRGIPAATNGPHTTWEAVDLLAPEGMTNEQFWRFCDACWPGRMENLKYTPSWVHLDIRNWGLKQRFNP